jgi:hypothetical protein
MKLPLTDTEALNACKESINTRIDTIAFKRKWKWRQKKWDIKVNAKYTTGTVAVVNGDRAVTGTTTVWTDSHKGWFFKENGSDEVYEVLFVDTATQTIQLSQVFVGASNATASYKLFQMEFGLPPDCEEIDLAWIDSRTRPLEITSPRKIVEIIVGNPEVEGKAVAITICGLGTYQGPTLDNFLLDHDFLEGEEGQDQKAVICPPVASEDYIIHLLYQEKITPLDADDDEPKLPLEKRHVLVLGAMADMLYRERLDDTAAAFEGKFEATVREIEADAEFTDEKPLLTVVNKWRTRRVVTPEEGDLGRWFDDYTPYD